MKINWNLNLLYKSLKDPKIEEDLLKIEKIINNFVSRFDVEDKKYLKDKEALFEILTEYEKMQMDLVGLRPLDYLYLLQSLNSGNVQVISQISLLENRLTIISNKLLFFEISIGTIEKGFREQIFSDQKFKPYYFQLKNIFNDHKYALSIPEEKIMELKSLPAYDMWIMLRERFLGDLKIKWKNKLIPYSEASNLVTSLLKSKDRAKLAKEITKEIKKVSVVAEAEINAIVTNKKINDDLRGYKNSYDATILGYRNDPETVNMLVDEVTKSFPISHRFYRLKAKILKQKKLKYFDRQAPVGVVKQKFDFSRSTELLKVIFGEINPVYREIIDRYVKNGQIDSHPYFGKTGGAYCSGSYIEPSYVLLNHNDDYRSFETYAHEMGHAFHTVLSRLQRPIYAGYSMVLAETASTLFESIALEKVFDSLSKREQIIALHDKINSDIATVFRQIACFNFERDIHFGVRQKGFLSKEELMNLHNKNMKAYLGPTFDLVSDDGLLFISWLHIRRFFYVYSYAFGLLVSKALLRKYRQDKSFWTSIEKFLSAGGKDTPENILLEIGIDVRKPEFWREGLLEIKEDIERLENLVKGNK